MFLVAPVNTKTQRKDFSVFGVSRLNVALCVITHFGERALFSSPPTPPEASACNIYCPLIL